MSCHEFLVDTTIILTHFAEKVDRIEKEHGWNITGNTGTTISMTFRREIELVFDVASFQSRDSTQQSHTSNSRIDLWYVAANRERDPQPSTPEREFFIQAIRDYVRTLDQTNTKISTLLRRVATAWNKAGAVADDVRVLNSTFPTNATRTGDSSIAINVALLLAPLQTKVQLSLDLRANPTPAGLQIALMPQAKVVYGEHFKVDNVCEYLSTRMGGEILSVDDHAEGESWSDIVVELHERLLARGQK